MTMTTTTAIPTTDLAAQVTSALGDAEPSFLRIFEESKDLALALSAAGQTVPEAIRVRLAYQEAANTALIQAVAAAVVANA